MKRLIAALALFPIIAFAAPEYVARSDDGSIVVVVTKEPCTNSTVLGLLTAQGVPEAVAKALFAARVTFEGRELVACYGGLGGGMLQIIDEEGDVSRVPVSAFVPLTGM